MIVGIYKPCKKVFFHDTSEDHAAWSSEVTKLARIYAHRGHAVHMCSETDLSEGDGVDNNISMYPATQFDVLFVFCGAFYESPDTLDAIRELKANSAKTILIVTDMSLLPRRDDALELFDVVLTQSNRQLPQLAGCNQQYADLMSITGYGVTAYDSLVSPALDKTIEFVFGGSERKRLADFIEYVWRPGHIVYTRSPFFDVNTKVSRDKYLAGMTKAVATICIADTAYNDNGFVTHRPVECAITNTLAFADRKYDPDCLLIPADHYLRVSNYIELRTKLNELQHDGEKYRQILQWQRDTFLPTSVSTGHKIYSEIRRFLI